MRPEFFKDALIWAELGMAAFAAFFTVMIIESISVIIFTSSFSFRYMLSVLVFPLLSFLLLSFVPLILAVLTYVKIIRPIRANTVPSKRWSSILEILGYVFGFLVGGILLWVANKKVKIAQE